MSDEKKTPAAENGGKPRMKAVRRTTVGRPRVAEQVREIIAPTADELGYFLWDVEYVKEGADWILRVTIDRLSADDGITIDDCERMTHAIDPILDEVDPIPDAYLLEVSSPGIERELTRPEHFALCAGEKVEVRLFAPADGSKVWTGILEGLDEQGRVTVTVGDGTKTFEAAAITKVRTVFDF